MCPSEAGKQALILAVLLTVTDSKAKLVLTFTFLPTQRFFYTNSVHAMNDRQYFSIVGHSIKKGRCTGC